MVRLKNSFLILMALFAISCSSSSSGPTSEQNPTTATPSPASGQTPDTVFVPSVVARPQIPSFEALVTNYGAVPDDGIDDTAAIQRGLDAVNAAGGGTLLFPKGRYDVSINPVLRRALTIYPRMRWRAAESATATIRLADNQMVYESIMAPATYPTQLDDAEFIGMTFDANGLNNPVRDPQETNGDAPSQSDKPTLRYFIRTFSGSRVRVADCTFLNADVGNVLSFNGTAITDVIVENSKFLNVGGALIDHDHSSVYFDGKRFLIAGNEFRGRNGAGTIGARTAIETHGDDIEVRDNLVDGFLQGVNIVGRISNPSRQILANNRFTNVAVGFNIWPLQDALSGSSFVSLTIKNNDVGIAADRWWRSPAMVVDLAAGIHFEAEIARARLDRLDILDNRITFDTFSGERANADRNSVGIGVRGVEGVLSVSNLAILRNTVRNAIGPCILSTAIIGPTRSSEIADNMLTDCARSPNFVGEGDVLRTGIAIGGTTSQLSITRNIVKSSGALPVMLTGALTASVCMNNCAVANNQLSGIAQATKNLGTGWIIQ
jgi:Pectate lyase superfamily protein